MEKEKKLERICHSLSHLMTMAVLELYPKTGLGVGTPIENGFYQDYDLPKKISDDILPKIEKRMKELIKEKIDFIEKEESFANALKYYKDDPYKTVLVNDVKKKGEKKATFFDSGNFHNLCKGPHVKNTREIDRQAFKLTKLAGAYWRGDEKNKMLTRIYGVAFETKKELDDYLKMMEEAEKRDHRKIGKDLGLFVFSDLVGPGLPLYTDKGAVVRREIQKYSNDLRTRIGYKEVHTPQMNKADLFKVSGHYEKFKEDMFKVISNHTKEEYFLKPMNCPQHTQIFASKMVSYKDMPVRIADYANLYRDEKPGELSGLTRLRAFSQDDGHCFCREDQIKDEFKKVLEVINEAMETYGMNYYIRLSLWDENNKKAYLGDKKIWDKSQKLLEKILKETKVDYIKKEGEAAFYGPKMDLVAKDSLGREWQLSTIQLDFNMPDRFKLVYTGKDGKKYTPVMIHSAIIGSPERFLAIAIEHYAGAFPVWLSPVQVKIISVGESHIKYCQELANEFMDNDIRAEVDSGDETVGNKIRKAIEEKVPYMLVIGDREIKLGKLAVRDRGEKKTREIQKKKFIKEIKEKIEKRK